MKLNSNGLIVLAVIWMIIMFVFSGEMGCLKTSIYDEVKCRSYCDRGDFILFIICGVGFLGPAYFGTLILNTIFGSLTEKE